MPRPMPPATAGGPDAGSNLCRSELEAAGVEVAAGIGAPARSPATDPIARSAGGRGDSAAAGDGSFACTGAAVGTAQPPSALTISSGPAGPCGPRFTLLLLAVAQSGLN